MSAAVELQHGERFGRLTVLRKVKAGRGFRYSCGCDCGKRCAPNATQLMKGRVKECWKCAKERAATWGIS